MSYDDWKCTDYADHTDDGFEFGGEEEPEFTCDCGAAIDPTLGGVSMCRACYESCRPVGDEFADTEPPPAPAK